MDLPSGYSLKWTGQYELLERVRARLAFILPLTLALIAGILYLNFRGAGATSLVLTSVPFAAVGSIWTLWLLGFNTSVAVWVGMIALLGDAEGGFDVAYSPLLDDEWPGPCRNFASADELLPALTGQWAFDRLRWFTHGYYAIHREGDDVVISDLRMGSEPAYVFRFSIARMVESQPVPAPTLQQSPLRPLGKAVGWLLSRVTAGHALPPPDEVLAEPDAPGRPSGEL